MNELEPILIDFQKPIGTLTIHKGFVISIYTKLPNRFHRLMKICRFVLEFALIF